MAPARLTLLSLLASAPAAALRHNAGREEEVDRSVTQNPACQCMPPAEVYANYSVRCGDGYGWEEHGVEDCNLFYMRMSEGLCWNIPSAKEVQDLKEDKGQWCYVSKDCPELNGGERVGKSPVAWKKCSTKEHDPITRTWRSKRLATWAKRNDMDMAKVFSMAYLPLRRFPFEKLKPLLAQGGKKFDLESVPKPWGPQIQEAMINNEKLFVASETKEQGIIDGFSVFSLTDNGEWTRGKAWHEKLAHPYKNTLLTLVKQA